MKSTKERAEVANLRVITKATVVRNLTGIYLLIKRTVKFLGDSQSFSREEFCLGFAQTKGDS